MDRDKTLSQQFVSLKQNLERKKERGHGEFLVGIKSIDEIINGIDKGQVMVVGGGPGSGKTSLALQMAYPISDNPEYDVLFISLEMTGQELVGRLLCNVMQMDNYFLRTGSYSQYDVNPEEKVDAFEKIIQQNSLQIIDNRGYRFEDIEEIIKEHYPTKAPDIIFIDFLQLIDWSDVNNQNAVIVSFIRKLTEIAKIKNMAIVLVSQLRRQPTGQNEQRRPSMHDLLGSGAIEQCAHVILMIYKEVLGDETRKYHIAIDKNRNGESGADILVNFSGKHFRFSDLDEIEPTVPVDKIKAIFSADLQEKEGVQVIDAPEI